MNGTIARGSIYPGWTSTQETTNARKGDGPSTATNAGALDWEIPILSPVSSGFGLSVITMLVLLVVSWWMLEFYNR